MLIATVMAVFALPGKASGDTLSIYDINYEVINETNSGADTIYYEIALTRFQNENFSGELIIPDTLRRIDTYNGKPHTNFYIIKRIGDGAFGQCSGLTSINLPQSVTSIGDHAFNNCSSLTSIHIPQSVTSIGDYAFNNCSSLTSINIPQGVTSIGDYAFWLCSGLTSINLPQSVTSIGNCAFDNCSSLTSINIPQSVTSIGDYAFNNCSSLTSIHIPQSVTSIGEDAFRYCSSLTSIIIPKAAYFSISIFGQFYGCTQLRTIVLLWNDATDRLDGLERAVPDTNVTIYAYPSEIEKIKQRLESNSWWKGDIKEIPICIDQEIGFSEVSFRIGDEIAGFPLTATSVEANGATITPDASGRYRVRTSGQPVEAQDIVVNFIFDGEEQQHRFTIISAGTPTLSIYDRTQTTATFTASASYDETIQPTEFGVYVNGQNYPVASGDIEDADSVKRGMVKVTGLQPGRTYSFRPYTIYNGQTFYGDWVDVETRTISAYVNHINQEDVTPTAITLTGSCYAGDAVVKDCWFMVGNIRYDGINLTATGLEPNRSYDVTFNYTTEDGSTASSSISKIITKELELTMLNPQPVSSTCAIVAAETNISDVETNVGFQWRKYEAPETLPSSEGYAAIYDGRIEGYIKRLQSASFYNARAFYKSNSGTYYYSDWVTFDPSDFSYFEPTVHTYAVETVTESTASVRGYVLAGTDEITSQGFEYWPEGGTESAAKQMAVAIASNAADDGVSVVFGTGQVMTATLDGLSPATTYRIRAFVTTAQGTTYGEEQTFTTAKPTGIAAAEEQAEAPAIVGYYDLSGRPLESPQKGITIVRYSDGTCKKIFKR